MRQVSLFPTFTKAESQVEQGTPRPLMFALFRHFLNKPSPSFLPCPFPWESLGCVRCVGSNQSGWRHRWQLFPGDTRSLLDTSWRRTLGHEHYNALLLAVRCVRPVPVSCVLSCVPQYGSIRGQSSVWPPSSIICRPFPLSYGVTLTPSPPSHTSLHPPHRSISTPSLPSIPLHHTGAVGISSSLAPNVKRRYDTYKVQAKFCSDCSSQILLLWIYLRLSFFFFSEWISEIIWKKEILRALEIL